MSTKKGICHMCRQERDLQHSDILSRFVLKPLYNEGPQYHLISSEFGHKPQKDQGGYKEHLLCFACEQKRSRWEQYTSKFIRSNKPGEYFLPPGKIIRNVDYTKIKLFILSTVWMCSISGYADLKNMKLGTHEEIIRGMLNVERSKAYPVMVVCLLNPWREELIIWNRIEMLTGEICYFFVMKGFLFSIFLSMPSRMPEYFFLPDKGDACLPLMNFMDIPMLRKAAKHFNDAGQLDFLK